MTFKGDTKLDIDTLSQLQRDYINSGFTDAELSEKYGISKRQIAFYAKKGDWSNAMQVTNQVVKEQIKKKIKEVVTPVILDKKEEIQDLIVSEAVLSKNHYDNWNLIGHEMQNMLEDKAQTICGEKIELKLSDYKIIADILEKVQSGQRLACGIDKNTAPEKNFNNINFNFFTEDMKQQLRQQMFGTAETNIKQIQEMVLKNKSE